MFASLDPKKFLTPFVSGSIKSIQYGESKRALQGNSLDSSNFGEYLLEQDQILPNLIDGSDVEMAGKFVSMQCVKGETLKFKATGYPKKESTFVCFPKAGKMTSDYAVYYGKDNIRIRAKVNRGSLFEKPRLVLEEACEINLSFPV